MAQKGKGLHALSFLGLCFCLFVLLGGMATIVERVGDDCSGEEEQELREALEELANFDEREGDTVCVLEHLVDACLVSVTLAKSDLTNLFLWKKRAPTPVRLLLSGLLCLPFH